MRISPCQKPQGRVKNLLLAIHAYCVCTATDVGQLLSGRHPEVRWQRPLCIDLQPVNNRKLLTRPDVARLEEHLQSP